MYTTLLVLDHAQPPETIATKINEIARSNNLQSIKLENPIRHLFYQAIIANLSQLIISSIKPHMSPLSLHLSCSCKKLPAIYRQLPNINCDRFPALQFPSSLTVQLF